MTCFRFLYTTAILMLSISLMQGQVSTDHIKHATEGHHTNQDSAYHCGMCSTHLFDEHEATSINDTSLHFHAVGTDESTSPFQCAACSSHLGIHHNEEGHYQVFAENVNQNEDGIFHCAACQLPLFDKQSVEKSDDSSTYFIKPIGADRIVIDKKEKFYKVTDIQHITCKYCDGRLGTATGETGDGFGVRINLGKVKKQKRG